jgi:hypothetical protein
MLKVIAIVVVVLIAAVLGYAATQPDTFRVERSAVVQAPPEKILPHLEDFHRWSDWSPWEKIDPNMQRTHSGAPKGKGAVYAWQGNSKAGAGRMEILESSASQVAVKLDFSKPFEAHNLVDFTLQPQGAATNVTWSMNGPQPYMMKVMCLFVSMDKMVGKDFEAGLANLKRVAEQ